MNLPTADDLRMIKRYILLPLVLSEFEQDRKSIGLTVDHAEPYDEMLQAVMDRVTVDLRKVTTYLRKHGIKVEDTEWTPTTIRARYICRGHTDVLSIMQYLKDADIKVALRHYLGLHTDQYIRKDLPPGFNVSKPDAVP
ncbi:hypothetical protein ACP26L_01390 [Paenibacillus sp. S-38]|uniref:hypothetical protein n=1 Tax=Paenibacillus sp. S-38 TaxID=3416710 RepID=UPI003CEE0719